MSVWPNLALGPSTALPPKPAFPLKKARSSDRAKACPGHGLRKQEIGARKQRAAHNRSYLTFPPQGRLIVVLQWLAQNGPLVAWGIVALFAGFIMLSGKV
jgi:hypothetical protein